MHVERAVIQPRSALRSADRRHDDREAASYSIAGPPFCVRRSAATSRRRVADSRHDAKSWSATVPTKLSLATAPKSV